MVGMWDGVVFDWLRPRPDVGVPFCSAKCLRGKTARYGVAVTVGGVWVCVCVATMKMVREEDDGMVSREDERTMRWEQSYRSRSVPVIVYLRTKKLVADELIIQSLLLMPCT